MVKKGARLGNKKVRDWTKSGHENRCEIGQKRCEIGQQIGARLDNKF